VTEHGLSLATSAVVAILGTITAGAGGPAGSRGCRPVQSSCAAAAQILLPGSAISELASSVFSLPSELNRTRSSHVGPCMNNGAHRERKGFTLLSESLKRFPNTGSPILKTETLFCIRVPQPPHHRRSMGGPPKPLAPALIFILPSFSY
jgi:hypothetical protein